jgi:radical SAM superfamily enzyme YgiQ (UPF0313 family)
MTYDVILFTDSIVGTWRMRSMGAYRLASELRRNGYSVKVLDWACVIFNDYQLCNSILSKLIGANTLFLGFSAGHFHKRAIKTKHFDHYDDYFDDQGFEDYPYPTEQKTFEIIISQAKKKNPNLKIVYGGGYTHESIKLSPVVDYVIYGLADATIIELASHLRNKTPLKWVPGAHPGQKFIKHDELGLSFDFPNSFTQYQPEDHIRQGEVLCIETSRGCMFKCKFCSFVLLGRKTTDPKYHKELSVLTQELKYNWDTYKVNKYAIVDDTFNESTEKIKMVAQAIKDAGVPDFKFWAYIRLDLLGKYPEQIQILRDMGLQSAYMGIESLYDPTLKLIGKPLKSEEVKKLLTEVKSHWAGHVNMHGAFILGLPGETPEIFNKGLEWLMDPNCPLDSFHTHVLNLSPVWPSIFGKNAEKLGYEIISDPTRPWGNGNWDNGIWTRQECLKMSKKLGEEKFYSRRGLPHSWEIIGLQNSGYTFEEIYRKPRFDFNRLEKTNILKQQLENYIKEICEYEGIDR